MVPELKFPMNDLPAYENLEKAYLLDFYQEAKKQTPVHTLIFRPRGYIEVQYFTQSRLPDATLAFRGCFKQAIPVVTHHRTEIQGLPQYSRSWIRDVVMPRDWLWWFGKLPEALAEVQCNIEAHLDTYYSIHNSAEQWTINGLNYPPVARTAYRELGMLADENGGF